MTAYYQRTTESRTHYETLGVERDATEAQIKKAYRKLALLHHPDKLNQQQGKGNDGRDDDSGGGGSAASVAMAAMGAETTETAQERFQKINAAYEILSDPEAREEYDVELELGYQLLFGVRYRRSHGRSASSEQKQQHTNSGSRTRRQRNPNSDYDTARSWTDYLYGEMEESRQRQAAEAAAKAAEAAASTATRVNATTSADTSSYRNRGRMGKADKNNVDSEKMKSPLFHIRRSKMKLATRGGVGGINKNHCGDHPKKSFTDHPNKFKRPPKAESILPESNDNDNDNEATKTKEQALP